MTTKLDTLVADNPLPSWRALAWPAMIMIAVAIGWSAVAELDEVAVSSGEVVPLGRIKVVQHLEGGIIKEIYVREGDTVKENQPLMLLDLASTGTNRDAEQLERYLHQVGKPVAEIRGELRPIAERRVRRSLVLSEVAEAEHIDVTGEEVEAEIERLVSGAGPQADELRRLFSAERAKDSLRRSLVTKKTLERLVAIACAGEAPAEKET